MVCASQHIYEAVNTGQNNITFKITSNEDGLLLSPWLDLYNQLPRQIQMGFGTRLPMPALVRHQPIASQHVVSPPLESRGPMGRFVLSHLGEPMTTQRM